MMDGTPPQDGQQLYDFPPSTIFQDAEDMILHTIREWEEQQLDAEVSDMIDLLQTEVAQYEELAFLDYNLHDCDNKYTESFEQGNELNSCENESIISPAAFALLLAEVGPLPPAAPAAPTILTAPSTVPEPQGADPVLIEAFSLNNIRQDLLRCALISEPSTLYPDDRLHFLVQEYARVMRFQCVRIRWLRMKNPEWYVEMSLIANSVNDGANGFRPWPLLHTVLNKFQDATSDYESLDAAGRKRMRLLTKRALCKFMRDSTDIKIAEIEAELQPLVIEKGLKLQRAKATVFQVVKEDCKEQGALLLRHIPGFAKGFFKARGSRLSKNWSWTD
jgi:hypothetical protein